MDSVSYLSPLRTSKYIYFVFRKCCFTALLSTVHNTVPF